MIIEYKKSVIRLIKILELLGVQEEPLMIRDIAKINNCTERTVYTDINELMEQWNHFLNLELSHMSLYSRNYSIGNIQYVTEQLLIHEPVTQLLRLLIECPKQSLEFYASMLNVSHQSIRKLITNLKRSLSQYGLNLISRSPQLSIVGDEFKVRYFCTVFYYHLGHSFSIEPSYIDYSPEVRRYFHNYPLISRFMVYIEFISRLRYQQGYTMFDSGIEGTLDEDVNATQKIFIDTLTTYKKGLEPDIDIIIAVLTDVGYIITNHDRDPILIMIASILYMEAAIMNKFNTHLQVVNLFVRNYEKVNTSQSKAIKTCLNHIIDRYELNTNQIVAGIIYGIDISYRMSVNHQRNHYVVYSATSRDHSISLKRKLESVFPHHHFYAYFGPVDYQIPRKNDLTAFCQEYGCKGIISTTKFSYMTQIPLIAIGEYLNGTDVGRLFDFINAT